MKRFTKNLKYTVVVLMAIIGLYSNSNQVLAGYIYTSGDVPYVVTAVSNAAPVCNAGANRSITLPVNSITIPAGGATATDSDGTIATISWTATGSSNPSTPVITNGTTLEPTFSSLVQGTYTFLLYATDNQGAGCAPSTMTVTVNAAVAVNQAPTANAGVDQTITLPTNGVSLSGSGNDPDGSITAYAWTKTGGPASGSITNASSASTPVTGLVAGVYTFHLVVTDNGTPGLTGSDDMVVTVNAAPVATGALSTTSNSCTIPNGSSTCSVTGLYWNSSGTTGVVSVVDTNTGGAGTVSSAANNPISSPLQVWIARPSTTFELRDNGVMFGTPGLVTITASCAGDWNGSMCVASNMPPSAYAGLDMTVGTPSATISGATATDSDGTVASTVWSQVSGPNTASISGGSTLTPTFSSLVTGSYTFRLTVTDNQGATSIDDMVVNYGLAVTVCNDGIDNDGDGTKDYRTAAGAVPVGVGDSGCTSLNDKSESTLKVIEQ